MGPRPQTGEICLRWRRDRVSVVTGGKVVKKGKQAGKIMAEI